MKHVMGPSSRTILTNVHESDIQPNAVDLRLDKVFSIGSSQFEISNDYKIHRQPSIELIPDNEGFFLLSAGHRYEVIMENIITVGEGECGWVITRSSLNRNGVFITSGLYDSGYHGVMAAVLHVFNGTARIKKGTRIGQYLSFDSESLRHYDGDYGIGKSHDKKYGV